MQKPIAAPVLAALMAPLVLPSTSFAVAQDAITLEKIGAVRMVTPVEFERLYPDHTLTLKQQRPGGSRPQLTIGGGQHLERSTPHEGVDRSD